MKPRHVPIVLLLAFLPLLPVACSDDEGPPAQLGVVSAQVVDGVVGPVAEQEVTLTPGNLTVITGDDGIARFEVAPGDYFVDAKLCCIGPGWISYHEPVTVTAGKTVEVTLQACLECD
jgi:hypothetical protein